MILGDYLALNSARLEYQVIHLALFDPLMDETGLDAFSCELSIA